MSKGGFSAVMKINRAEFASGFYGNSRRGAGEIEMQGYIHEDLLFQYQSYRGKRNTYAFAFIEFDDSPDFSEYSGAPSQCIGEVRACTGEGEEITAHMKLVLPTEMQSRLLALRNEWIALEPIFCRKPNERETFVEDSEHDGQIRYIERVYFEASFPTDEP